LAIYKLLPPPFALGTGFEPLSADFSLPNILKTLKNLSNPSKIP